MRTTVAASKTLDIWAKAAADAAVSPSQIDRREKLSRDEFLHEYVLKNRPVVLVDAARDWPAVGRWTPQFFKERFGSKVVPVLERKRSVSVKDRVALADYVDEITSSTFENRAKYLFSLKIRHDFPDLLRDLEPHPTYWGPNWLDSDEAAQQEAGASASWYFSANLK
jgi:hypothetical protein